jgi:hypothetical protein
MSYLIQLLVICSRSIKNTLKGRKTKIAFKRSLFLARVEVILKSQAAKDVLDHLNVTDLLIFNFRVFLPLM